MPEAPTTSLWRSDRPAGARGPLAAGETAEICVVGAGISGLTTAYLLAREGANVVVVEAQRVASGESARTTAHLVNVLDRRFSEIKSARGRDGVRAAIESHARAIDEIEATIAREGIDCDFERLDGYLIALENEDELDTELEIAHEAGFEGVEKVPDFTFGGLHGPALRFPLQAMIHPTRYFAGLADAVERAGGRIYEQTQIRAIEREGERFRLTTASGRNVSASHVVVATNSPIDRSVSIHTKQAAYRTYVICARVDPAMFPRALVWDTADPFHYVRLGRTADGEFLIVGGEDHKTGQERHTDERFARLERWAGARWPSLEWSVRWSGQVMESVDGLALIGREPGAGNLWVATGDSGNGMTHGTLAGLVLRDAIRGRENPWASLYDPGRFPLRSVPRWASENLNVAAQLPRYLAPGEESSDGPAPGRGAIIKRGLKPIAAYRDAAGVLHERSAVCPHLGCVVAWNESEASWDCPCHGSRFDAHGRVIAGPAARDLAALDDEDTTEPQPAHVSKAVS